MLFLVDLVVSLVVWVPYLVVLADAGSVVVVVGTTVEVVVVVVVVVEVVDVDEDVVDCSGMVGSTGNDVVVGAEEVVDA